MKSKYDLEGYDLPLPIREGLWELCTWKGIDFEPTQKYHHVADKASVRASGLGRLKIYITWGQTAHIHIENSPHKVMQGDSNHGDFHLREMKSFIDLVSGIFGIPYCEAKLYGKIEIAVNLIEAWPDQFISELDTHKFKPFDPMQDGAKVYGKRSKIEALKLKIYNPWLKSKLQNRYKPTFANEKIRIECVVRIGYLKKRGVVLTKVGDLLDKNIASKLGQLLTEATMAITYIGILPKVKARHLAIYYFFRHATKEEIHAFKNEQSRTYWNHRKIYCKLEKEKSFRENDLPMRVLEKWNHLANYSKAPILNL